MNSEFSTVDIVVFIVYAIVILAVGLYVSRGKKGEEKNGRRLFFSREVFTLVGDWRLFDCC